MKTPFKYIAFFIFILYPFLLISGPGPACIYHIEVSSEKKKFEGYVWLDFFISDQKESVLTSDSLFTEFVLNYNREDSLYLFREIYFVDSLDLGIFFKDMLVKIDEKEIKRIRFKNKIETGFGNWVSPERFSLKDMSWLKKEYSYKETLWNEGCDFDLYFFEKPDKSLLEEIKSLKSDSPKEYGDKLYDFLKKLEKYKVVVRHYCSC